MAVQFKYGDTWQHKYRIGENLQWGGNDIGSPGRRQVLVAGLAGPCPRCGADPIKCELVLESDSIKAVKVSGDSKVHDAEDRFIVLDE